MALANESISATFAMTSSAKASASATLTITSD